MSWSIPSPSGPSPAGCTSCSLAMHEIPVATWFLAEQASGMYEPTGCRNAVGSLHLRASGLCAAVVILTSPTQTRATGDTRHSLFPCWIRARTCCFAKMDIKGLKPGQRSAQVASESTGGGVGFAERLSICGQFAISKQGAWRALETSQRTTVGPAMAGLDTDGKQLSASPSVRMADSYMLHDWQILSMHRCTSSCTMLMCMQSGGHLGVQPRQPINGSANCQVAKAFRQHGILNLK